MHEFQSHATSLTSRTIWLWQIYSKYGKLRPNVPVVKQHFGEIVLFLTILVYCMEPNTNKLTKTEQKSMSLSLKENLRARVRLMVTLFFNHNENHSLYFYRSALKWFKSSLACCFFRLRCDNFYS